MTAPHFADAPERRSIAQKGVLQMPMDEIGRRDIKGARTSLSDYAPRPNGRFAKQLSTESQLAEATRRGDIPSALRMANALIRLDPAAAVHHYNKALLCQHQREIELAVYEFMHTIWLDPDGPYSDPARSFLEDLDELQLDEIAILANEDMVFRTKLTRNPQEAAMERGFALSPVGEQLLREYCSDALADGPPPIRAQRYQ